MRKFAFLLVILGINYASGYNSYFMVAPDTIRPDMEYMIQFTKLTSMPKIKLKATIYTVDEVMAKKSKQVSAARILSTIALKMPSNLASSIYTLEVTGTATGGLEVFSESTTLTYAAKKSSIFIQTDKAIYKPGQTVQYRALATQVNLRVLQDAMDIHITDPLFIRVAQWTGVSGEGGVYQGHMTLSDQPPLGTWTINVNVAGASESTSFKVEEYVLPKFAVTVDLPSYALWSGGNIYGEVKAKYTYGKGVEGPVVVRVLDGSTELGVWSRNETSYQLSADQVNGVSSFEVDMGKLTEILGSPSWTRTLKIVAEVTETLTGNTRSGSSEITIYHDATKITFLESPENFKPGLIYTAYVYVSGPDDKPLQTAVASQIELKTTMYYYSDNTGTTEPTTTTPEPTTTEDYYFYYYGLGGGSSKTKAEPTLSDITVTNMNITDNGMIKYKLDIPIYIEKISLQAIYDGHSASKTLEKFHSSSRTFVQIRPATNNPKAGKLVTFKIRSTLEISVLYYTIIARGVIVKAGKINMANRMVRSLKFKAKAEMAPFARITVYYITDDAEVVADSTEFKVNGIFANQVSVRYTYNGSPKVKSKPGKEINVKVIADPGSIAYVLGVDKSVLLLATGNDLTIDKVEDELDHYQSHESPACQNFFCPRKMFGMPLDGTDVTTTFDNAGLKVLTDAYMHKYAPPRPVYYFMSYSFAYEDAPVMMMRTVTGATPGSTVRVRTEFPETWLFDSVVVNETGKAEIQTVVPDTITSFITTAFAVSETSGLGIAAESAKLQVFMKFFVRLDLPYSVIRGEQVILLANVFNYLDEPLEVEVELAESSAFENIIVTKEPGKKKAKLLYQHTAITRTVLVPGNGAVAVKFPIRAKEVGNSFISVQALSAEGGDAVRKVLLVKAEGIPEEYGIPILVDLSDSSIMNVTQAITLPDDVVNGSVSVRVSVIGDLMGPSISGITNLLKMPYGCGEQNMINMVANIYVIKYLETIDALTSADLLQAQEYMLVGYQKELTYQHFDGSYSAFGMQDSSGSTWLTAFVIKSFAQASPYIYIDGNMMRSAINWLIGRYSEKTGTFEEPGNVIHKEMQGGSGTGEINLAAYVAVALLEARQAGFTSSNEKRFTMAIEGSLAMLEDAADEMDNAFELALTGYAMVLAEMNTTSIMQALDDMAIVEDGMRYWQVVEEEEPIDESAPLRFMPPYHQAQSFNIETTAYVLLIQATLVDIPYGVGIVNWLVRQRNPNGGFGSTQDTVVALHGLSEFAGLLYTNNTDISILVTATPTGDSHIFTIDVTNTLVLQKTTLDCNSTSVQIQANGTGKALVQVTVSYNVMEAYVKPQFKLKLMFTDETLSGFKLETCFKWLKNGTSGMAVMEVGLLSGFSANKFTLSDLSILKKIEDGHGAMLLYFNEIPGEMTCFSVKMEREGLVVGSQPAVVKLYDYYQTENQVTTMYQPELLMDSNVCDLDGDALGC